MLQQFQQARTGVGMLDFDNDLATDLQAVRIELDNSRELAGEVAARQKDQ